MVVPAVAPTPSVSWTNEWGPKSTPHDAHGRVGYWGVRFTGATPGRWLIQSITNHLPYVEHCDGSAYPGATPTAPEPTRRYFEAWWVDATGKVMNPKSIETPPAKTTEPSMLGDDIWKFNTRSAAPTRGQLFRTSTLYMTATLPDGFALGAVPEANELPSSATTPAELGAAVSTDRSADVQWDYAPADATIAPWQEMRTTVP